MNDDLLSMAPFPTLVGFAETSAVRRQLAEVEAMSRVCRMLELHGFNGEAFLAALHDFRAIFAGPFVLSLLDPVGRETYKRIDIIAGDELYSLLVHWIEKECGAIMYQRLRFISDFPQGSFRYADLFKFNDRDIIVRLIRSVHYLPQFLIPQYPATHLMNYIAADHIVVAYPQLTFTRRSIQLRDIPPSLESSFTTGSRMTLCPSIRCDASLLCGAALRWFNDPECAVLGLQEEYEVLGLVHWELGGEACQATCRSRALLVEEDPVNPDDEM